MRSAFVSSSFLSVLLSSLTLACGAASHGHTYESELQAEERAARDRPAREQLAPLMPLRPPRPWRVVQQRLVEGEEILFRSMRHCGTGPIEVELELPAGSQRNIQLEAMAPRGMPIRMRAYLNDTLVASGGGGEALDPSEHEGCNLEVYRTGRRVRARVPEGRPVPVGNDPTTPANTQPDLGTEELAVAPSGSDALETKRLPVILHDAQALNTGGRLRVVLFSETPIDWSGTHFRLADRTYETDEEATRVTHERSLRAWRERVALWEARLAASGLSEAELQELHSERNEPIRHERAEGRRERVLAFDRLWESCAGDVCRRQALHRSCEYPELPLCAERRDSLRSGPSTPSPEVVAHVRGRRDDSLRACRTGACRQGVWSAYCAPRAHYDECAARAQARRAPGEPPPLREEDRGTAPSEGARWVEGTWSWNGEAYEWLAGVWREGRAAAPVVVALAPPPPRMETPAPPAPAPGSVWVSGHWRLADGAYRWATGEWKRPPAQGQRWQAPTIELRVGGSLFTPGQWN